MTGVSGKAEGRCRGVEGVYGRFSATFRGAIAARSWRDGQTSADPENRPAWAIIDRGGWTWCLPPYMAEQAEADPEWIPPWPVDLEPLEVKLRLNAEAAAAGLPPVVWIPPTDPPRKRAARKAAVA